MKIRKIVAISLLVFGTIAANDVAPSNSELEAMYDKAFRAFDTANYVEALKELDAIDARKPDLAASQNLRGVIYMRQGIYDKAEAALSEAQRLDPKFWNARFNLAEIPFLKQQWPEARKRFQELLTSNASDLQGEATQLIQYKILLTYLLEGNDTMADSILAKFELSPDTPAVHYANAAISLQRQSIPDAKRWMTAAEKNFSPQLNKLFAESLYEIGWLQKVPGQQRPALQLLTPEERATKAKAIVKSQFEQAQQAYEQRDLEAASKLAEQADTADPNQPQILNLRGEILLEQQKFDDAEGFFKSALKVDPKFREAQFNLADMPFRQKDYAKARDRFQALFKQTPGGDKNQAAQLINFKIFMTYLLEGKESRAQKMMEQFQFSGDTPALYYAQAAWEFKHNKPDKANDWITSARKIYPSASNEVYGTGFYDLGWLKSAVVVSSPTPTGTVNAAAVASAQTESSAPAIEPSPIPGSETKMEENVTQFSLAQAPAPSPVTGMETTSVAAPSAPKASEAPVNPTPVEVIVSNASSASTSGSPARPEDVPAAPSTTGISPAVESPSATATPAVALASAAPVNVPAIAAIPEVSAPTPEPVETAPPISAPALTLASPEPTAESAQSATAAPVVALETTPATGLAPANVGELTPVPSLGERLDRLAGPHPMLVTIFLVSGLGLLVLVLVPEIRRRISSAQIWHRPATVTGPPLHDHEEVEQPPALQTQKRFVGGPRHVSVQLKASEPSLRRGVVPIAKKAPDSAITAFPEHETINGDTRVVEPAYAEFEESSVGPVIEQGRPSGEAASVAEATSFVSLTSVEPVAEQIAGTTEEAASVQTVEREPLVAIEEEPSTMAESEPMFEAESGAFEARVSDTTIPEPITPPQIAEEFATPDTAPWPETIEQGQPVPMFEAEPGAFEARVSDTTIPEPTTPPQIAEEFATPDTAPWPEPIEQGQPVPMFEAESGLFEARVSDTTIPEPITPPQIAEEFATPDTAPWPEPIEQGQPVPYQTVVTAEESAEIAVSNEPEISPSASAEIAGVGRAIAGIGALRSTSPLEIPLAQEPHFASQPTTIETMPETLQTPTAPVIRTSGAPIQPNHPTHNAPAPQAAAAGTHTAVQITLSCEIASMQLTPTFKMGALQLRPISKVVTMRLASSPQQQQAGMNLQVNFEISKVQPSAGSLGQMRLSPSQQQKPATNTSGSFNISGLQLVSGFEAAPLQLTPSQQGQASVHLTGAFQITTVEFSPTFDIAAIILNASSKTVAVQLPGAGAVPIENAPMFEITNVQLAGNGDIAMLQLNPVGARRA